MPSVTQLSTPDEGRLAADRPLPDVAELVERAARLSDEVAEFGAKFDDEADDTAGPMRRCAEEQLFLLTIPTEFGGLSDGAISFAMEAVLRSAVHLAAGDGSAGQNYVTSHFVLRQLFHPQAPIPAEVKAEIAKAVIERGARLVASNSEAGSPTPASVTETKGGVLLNGAKTFNTNSGGAGYAHVGMPRPGVKGRYHCIVPLDAPGVRFHQDWDNMGQRATNSQMITYENVFVPDGWHYLLSEFDPRLIPWAFIMHASLLQGIGQGALRAALAHLRKSNRVLLVAHFKAAGEDPLIKRLIGDLSTKLRASDALLREVARNLESVTPTPQALGELMIDAMRAKAASLESSVETTSAIFDLLGARATANKYRFDRFWRNCRTFSVHDPIDALRTFVGGWELEGQPPPLAAQFKL